MTCDIRELLALVWNNNMTKGMEFSNITCHDIVSNKGREFCNITCHGIVSKKGMEFYNITCHGIFKQGHGVL
jgi:hypothetical protein